MTAKLYDLDAYGTSFEATVLACEEENGLFKVELDRTLFFPEEGGQTPDKGFVNDKKVCDVKIKNGVIFHYLESAVEVGSLVNGEIDFEHRFRNMQMHSGEHIFSGLTYKKYGYNNVGFHLSDNSATIDIDNKLSYEELMELETDVNRVIFSNVSINASYPSKEELDALEYRSKKELSGDIRIVSIEDVDICACCAPHVHRTGEIGLFKIISYDNYKGGVRINYLCGLRALLDYEKRLSELRDISRTVNAKSGEEADKVLKIMEENALIKSKVFLLTNELIEMDIKANFDGKENGIKVLPKSDDKNIKNTMNIMRKYYSGTSYVFCGDDETGYRFLIESSTEDLSVLLKLFKENLDIKGGGKSDSIQGSINSEMSKIYELIEERVNG